MKVTSALIKELKKAPLETLKKLPVEDVVSIIQEANYQYYTKGKPIVSDALYDVIKDYLHSESPNHPILSFVGAVVSNGKKIKLPYWMGSLDKIKSNDKEVDKWLNNHSGHVVVSDKLDGNSAMFSWDATQGQGKLFTRGNGSEGQDISHIIPFVQHIPKPKESLVVRGELIISKKAFQEVSAHGKNARNMVAGLLNAKKPDMMLLRRVEFVAYELLCCTPRGTILSDQIKSMTKHGFKVVYHLSKASHNVNVATLSQILQDRRAHSPYEVDGIVVCHDAPNTVSTQGNPSYAFAFKSMAFMDRAEVTVTSVEWNLSKDGLYKPVVVFDGVELSGVTVRRATGHNAKFIVENKIGAGARIMVTRSGDVIPYIEAVLEGADVVDVPSGKGVQWNESGVDLIWSNTSCYNPELAFKTMAYFFEKVDVHGMSKGTLRKLFNAGFDTVSKVWNIDKPSLLTVDGIKGKMADNIIREMGDMRNRVDAITLMAASNCYGRGIGVRILTSISKVCPEIVKGEAPSIATLLAINGVEQKTAKKIIEGTQAWKVFIAENGLETYVRVPNNSKSSKLASKNNTGQANAPPKQAYLAGKSIVFTGVRDKDLEKLIVAAGGEVKTSVSKKTSIVVYAPDKPASTKLKDAEKNGIPTMTLAEFRDVINATL
jgi:NAD-dependent DNA ligase